MRTLAQMRLSFGARAYTHSTFGSTFATFASGQASATASYMAQTEVG